MKRETLIEAMVFVVLVTAGSLLRLSLHADLPNFAPVAALALFAGYFFRSRLTALAVPVTIMAITDWQIGGYAWYQMVVVYTMLTLPIAMRTWLRSSLKLEGAGWKGMLAPLAGLIACSFTSSVLFYLATNAACLGNYEASLTGVVNCYVQGLPFFRYTLAGDMFFAVTTFGLYAVALQLSAARSPEVKLSLEA